MNILLSFDEELNPVGVDQRIFPADLRSAPELYFESQEGRYMGRYDLVLLRRQLWNLRNVEGLLNASGLPDEITENLSSLGDVVYDLLGPYHEWQKENGLDDEDLEEQMPALPDELHLVSTYQGFAAAQDRLKQLARQTIAEGQAQDFQTGLTSEQLNKMPLEFLMIYADNWLKEQAKDEE